MQGEGEVEGRGVRVKGEGEEEGVYVWQRMKGGGVKGGVWVVAGGWGSSRGSSGSVLCPDLRWTAPREW